MSLLEDLGMLFLNFKFVMIHIIRKTLVFIKDHITIFKMILLNAFKIYNKLLFFFKKIFFHNIQKFVRKSKV